MIAQDGFFYSAKRCRGRLRVDHGGEVHVEGPLHGGVLAQDLLEVLLEICRPPISFDHGMNLDVSRTLRCSCQVVWPLAEAGHRIADFDTTIELGLKEIT